MKNYIRWNIVAVKICGSTVCQVLIHFWWWSHVNEAEANRKGGGHLGLNPPPQ